MKFIKKLIFTTSIAFAIAVSFLAMTAKALGLSQETPATGGFGPEAGAYVGAGLAVGLAGLGSSIGMGTAGAAAIGAVSEDRTMFGNALVFIVLIEAVAIYGLLIALLLIFATG